MPKAVKTTLLTLAILAAVSGLVYGVLLLARGSGGAVKVYAVQDFSMTDYVDGGTETSGSVKADHLQNVYLSGTQQVTEVLAKEGQQVNKGDVLLRYDTTLSDLALQQAKIQAQKLQAQLETARRELTALQNQQPSTPSKDDETPLETPFLLSGKGTEDDPLYILWGTDNTYSRAYLKTLLPQGAAEGWAVFLVRMGSTRTGAVEESWGLHLTEKDGEITFRMYQPQLPPAITGQETEKGLTAEELAVKRARKEQEIKKLTISAQIAQVEYEKKQQEKDSGTVTAKTGGVVKTVRDAKTASLTASPVIEISDGGGFYVEAACSELDRAAVRLGQSVTIRSWENNNEYRGTVTALGDTPMDSSGSNTYYPLTVQVSGDAKMREGEMVQVLYTPADTQEGIYLQNEFILTENGKSVVFIRGTDGRLEERTVRTGKSAWGYYTQVLDGLTVSDYVAFPYGNTVRSGAQTTEATPDQFYGY